MSPQTRWVRIGASTPPVERCSHAHTAEDDSGKAEHQVGAGHDGPDVYDGRNGHRIEPTQRGVERAAKEHLFGDPVDQGDHHDQEQRSLAGKLQHADYQLGGGRNLTDNQGTQHKDAAQQQTDGGPGDHRALVATAPANATQMQGAGGQRAQRPYRGQGQRQPVEGRPPRAGASSTVPSPPRRSPGRHRRRCGAVAPPKAPHGVARPHS